MIEHFIEKIGGLAVLGTISICLFFVVFGGAMLWAWCQEKTFLTKMGAMPLSDAPAAKGDDTHE